MAKNYRAVVLLNKYNKTNWTPKADYTDDIKRKQERTIAVKNLYNACRERRTWVNGRNGTDGANVAQRSSTAIIYELLARPLKTMAENRFLNINEVNVDWD